MFQTPAHLRVVEAASCSSPGMKPSKSDSFLLAQVRNSELSGDSLGSDSQDSLNTNKSVSGTSLGEGESSTAVTEQASEDSLISHTTNNLNMTDSDTPTANGETGTESPALGVSVKCTAFYG